VSEEALTPPLSSSPKQPAKGAVNIRAMRPKAFNLKLSMSLPKPPSLLNVTVLLSRLNPDASGFHSTENQYHKKANS
jgi:hypothetical protein